MADRKIDIQVRAKDEATKEFRKIAKSSKKALGGMQKDSKKATDTMKKGFDNALRSPYF